MKIVIVGNYESSVKREKIHFGVEKTLSPVHGCIFRNYVSMLCF